MKPILLIIISIFLFSCDSKAQTKNSNKENINHSDHIYGKKLLEKDFLKYADDSKKEDLKTQLINNFDIYDENNLKIVHIDAEALAEFNFDFFLPQLNTILQQRNLHLIVEPAADYEKTNDIIINNEKIKLYTQKEVDNQLFWDTAPRNFFKKINEILQSNHLDEQFYLLYGGNDLQSILLTNEQFSIISEYFINNEEEKPYKP